MSTMSNSSRGFTIVELLIVIVVISVLAGISITAYNGVQARSSFSVMQADFVAIKKAIEMYKSINGVYPNSADCTFSQLGWCGWDQRKGDAFIPGLVPAIVQTLPTLDDSRAHADTYLYQSRGADCTNTGSEAYQLIRYNPQGLNSAELSSANTMKITESGYDGIAWGVKTSNCASWW